MAGSHRLRRADYSNVRRGRILPRAVSRGVVMIRMTELELP